MSHPKLPHKFTNRLINETSPYLIQHAHNPVDWYPWGEEAFEHARQTNKPVFLSIGYSACHWCHVMERESFEDEATAEIMNSHFISIKVDREERPDLDGIYMTAVQMITGHGGWPMSVWLDHEGRPFYGGTYFPPVERHQLPSFRKVLLALADMWKNKNAELMTSAAGLTLELEKSASTLSGKFKITPELLDGAAKTLAGRLDPVHGGFGNAPKFPSSMSLQFLLRHFHFTGHAGSAKAVELSLNRMAAGGIYDHLGGGFARYSVDAEWHVPHFEKMLYDNALLIRIYTEAWLKLGKDLYRDRVIESAEFILREMKSQDGGFYSTLDADSEGVEGKFYAWTWEEFTSVVSPEDLEVMTAWYDVKKQGNWEHTNVLRRVKTAEQIANENQLPVSEVHNIVKRNSEKLFKARSVRIRPARDEKILTSWNGLMISALVYAGFSLDRKDFLAEAEKAAEWIWNNQFRDQVLYRVYKDGQSRIPGFSDDYGNFLLAITELAMYSGHLIWLNRAQTLAELLISRFRDETDGGFFVTASDSEKLIIRNKDFFDNAEPSGHSSATWALQILGRLTGENKYSDAAALAQELLSGQVKSQPGGFGWMACSMIESIYPGQELVLIKGEDSADPWIQKIHSVYRPGSIFLTGKDGDLPNMYADKLAINGKTTLFSCMNYSCQAPETDPDKWNG
ncbi:MAG: thioredoxin domain-containing protein [Bacteroidetes bacterium]|nr:thioredoxin domain-containing protein [Bacteroidota bacterium]